VVLDNRLLDAQSVDVGDFFMLQTVPATNSYQLTNVVTLPMSASGSYTRLFRWTA